MLKTSQFAFMLCTSIFFMRCASNLTESDNIPIRDLTMAEKSLVQSDNRFGFKLFRKIVEAEADKNIFISPLSISMALGMTLLSERLQVASISIDYQPNALCR